MPLSVTAADSFSNDNNILEGSHLHLRAIKSKINVPISKTKTGVFFVLAKPVTKWPNAISVSWCSVAGVGVSARLLIVCQNEKSCIG